MRVIIRVFTTLREIIGKKRIILEFDNDSVSLKGAIEKFIKIYGDKVHNYLINEEGEVRSHLQILVNGKNTSLLNNKDTLLKEGDQIAILPPVSGG